MGAKKKKSGKKDKKLKASNKNEASKQNKDKKNAVVAKKKDRDVEKAYSNREFAAKLRRLADSIENGKRFEIQIAGERVYVPVRAICNIEHERGDGEEEIEFQIKWSKKG